MTRSATPYLPIPLAAPGQYVQARLARSTTSVRTARIALILITLAVVAGAMQWRWSIASTKTWQCDEIPLLVRFTGACGYVTCESEAREFTPSFYSWYRGALRAVRPPQQVAALHTTTNFWVNLTTHLFGVTPLAARVVPLMWSAIAIVIAAWAAWLIVRTWSAACVAAVLCALSPHGIAYAAEARGYAEAMALAPLLLITLELYRRRPDRRWVALIVLACAIQAALTVYTIWVYWVFPLLLAATWMLPRRETNAATRRTLRTVLLLILCAVCLAMLIFTIQRWALLRTSASQMGIALSSAADAWWFVTDVATHIMVRPVVMVALIPVGVYALWISKVRWWAAPLAAGILLPLAMALANGSAGYARNLGYLVVPCAALAACGADTLFRGASRRMAARPVGIVTATAALLLTVWTITDLPARARAIYMPDWGDGVSIVDSEPERIGPRWFCPSLANHWQIDWYRSRRDLGRFLSVPIGGTIEVVLGSQIGERGGKIIYQVDPSDGSVRQLPVPKYIAREPIAMARSGVDVRRCRAMRLAVDEVRVLQPYQPIFLLVTTTQSAETLNLSRLLRRTNADRDVLVFKSVVVDDRTVWSLIVPAGRVGEIRRRVETLAAGRSNTSNALVGRRLYNHAEGSRPIEMGTSSTDRRLEAGSTILQPAVLARSLDDQPANHDPSTREIGDSLDPGEFVPEPHDAANPIGFQAFVLTQRDTSAKSGPASTD